MRIFQKELAVTVLLLLMLPASPALACINSSTESCQPLAPLMSKALPDFAIVQQVLNNQDRFKVQILYTQINRLTADKVDYRYYQYGLDESRYFYPASTVKLPVSLLALQWLNQQQLPGLNKETTMLTDSSRPAQVSAASDDTAETKLPSIAQYIKKILLVSDNDGYNRLYELLGQEYINEQLKQKGLNNTVINHRLSMSLAEIEQRHYNPVRFIDGNGQLMLSIPARSSDTRFVNEPAPMLGKAYIANNELVSAPMDFSEKNRFSVADFTGVLQRIFFPQSFSPAERFQITESQRHWIIRYMGLPPSASHYPHYNIEQYPDNYAKFLMVGGQPQQIPEQLKIFNKTGWAYGHAIDGAYIVDTANNIEFLLVAVIYANENDTLNDDNYQLDEIAKPFLRQLGQLIYQYELERPREFIPDLSQLSEITE